MEFWERLLELLNSTSVLTIVVGALIIAFAKAIIRIFRMGVNFATEMASKKELNEFSAEVKQDMRAYAQQIQRAVLESVMRVVDSRLQNVDNVNDTANDMKLLKIEIENEVKNAIERIDDVKSLSDTVRALSNKVSRLEFNGETRSERRKED